VLLDAAGLLCIRAGPDENAALVVSETTDEGNVCVAVRT